MSFQSHARDMSQLTHPRHRYQMVTIMGMQSPSQIIYLGEMQPQQKGRIAESASPGMKSRGSWSQQRALDGTKDSPLELSFYMFQPSLVAHDDCYQEELKGVGSFSSSSQLHSRIWVGQDLAGTGHKGIAGMHDPVVQYCILVQYQYRYYY